jgi:hypothetical protein
MSVLGRRRGEVGGLAFVVALVVRELRQRLHVARIDDHQEIVMRLQVDVPSVRWRANVRHHFRVLRVAHVDNAEALRNHVPDIGVAVMDHELVAVGSSALVAEAVT